MQINYVFDLKAEKQFQQLDNAVQAQIRRDLDTYADDVLKYEGKWLDFWAVQSDPYRILIRAEHEKKQARVMDISRKRFTQTAAPVLEPETASPGLQIAYEPKAQKQLNALSAEIQEQIRNAIDRDMPIYESNGTSSLKGFGNIYTGAFWAVQSEPYRILIRVEHDKNRVLVMDVSRKRFA